MTPATDSPESLARQFGDRLAAEDTETAADRLTEDGREAVVESFPEDFQMAPIEDAETALQRYAYGLYSQYGEYEGVERVDATDANATVTLSFEHGTQDVVLSLAEDGIVGVEFPTEYTVPEYVDEDAFEEREVVVEGDDVELEGLLTVPADDAGAGDGPYPGVLLVHGAGLHDPDGTAGASKILRDFAWGLASEGVATLRYEKRPNVQDIPDEELTLDRLVVDDAVAAVETLADAPDVSEDAVFVAGHSQGGMCAPRIADRFGDAAGLLTLDGVPDPGLDKDSLAFMKYSFEPDGDLSAAQQELLEERKAEYERVIEGDYEDDEIVLGKPGRWHREIEDVQTRDTAERLDAAVFALTASRADPELQADLADSRRERYEEWDEMEQGPQDRVEFYPDVGHYFQDGPTPATMEGLHFGGNVAGYVLADVAEWVHEVVDS
jgi:dienelactone hydrolase